MRIAFGSASSPFVLDVPDGPVGERASTLFRARQVEAAPEGWGPSPSAPGLVVRETSGGFELTSPGDAGVHVVESVTEILAEVEFAVVGFLLGQGRRLTHLHAAGAVVPGREDARAILAVGGSGAGKSSLALAWSLADLPLLGDDVVMVGESGVLHPFRRWLKVDRRRAGAHGLAGPAISDADTEGREVWYDPPGDGAWADEPALPRLLALIRYQAGSEVAVRPVQASDGLEALMSGVLETGLSSVASFERLATVADGAEVVEVVLGDPDAAARALVERVRLSDS